MNNPLADDEPGPVGEYPDVPARSGVTALLAATAAADKAAEHARNLQRAIDDIRIWCHGYGLTGAAPVQEILNIIRSHHV